MSYTKLGELTDFDEHGRLFGDVEGRQVAAFRINDDVVAYENHCPHLGGPVCQGKLARAIETTMTLEDGIVDHFSETAFRITCPWHGYEFDAATGVCPVDTSFRLRKYEVLVNGDEVYARRSRQV
jgi:nitrite reductase (NADH) small subunit